MLRHKGYPEAFLLENIQQHHVNTQTFILNEQPVDITRLTQAANNADLILFVSVNALLDANQVTAMKALLTLKRPIIGLAAYSPYDILAFPELGTYAVTYEYTQPAITAVLGVLFGEIPAQGRLPISLPGIKSAEYRSAEGG